MSRAFLIAHGVPDDAFHDEIFGSLRKPVHVAYIGIANGNQSRWFARVRNALERRHHARVELVASDSTDDALAQIERADLVYVAGGDVALLSDWYASGPFREAILARQAAGATLVGVSAGAIGLAPWWIRFAEDSPAGRDELLSCAGALPFVVDCHDEESDWEELRALLTLIGRDDPSRVLDGYGIPSDSALAMEGELGHEKIRALGPPPKRLRLERGQIIEVSDE